MVEKVLILIIDSKNAEKDAILTAAKLMVASARTAPKGRGEDKIKTMILVEEDKDKIASVMDELGSTRNAKNVRDSDAVVLIGVDFGDPLDKWINYQCKLIDLGIAIGSAVTIASQMNIDNRIMATIGRAAAKMGIMKADEIQGIPLSTKGKNIFFDRRTT